MAKTLVGSVASLWRYPVKSMQGEALESTALTARGLLGDRAYALWDRQTQRVASAKNPKKWANLLNFQARFTKAPDPEAPLPPVTISWADAQMINSHQSDVNQQLSQALGRSVELLTSAPAEASLDQYWPDVEGTVHRETITQLLMPAGTFFDSCPVHVLTTATLKTLAAFYPKGAFEPCRFRPNLLIKPTTTSDGFVEDSWVGKLLTIGDTVQLKVDTHCPRCVVTTLEQSGLPEDLSILKTTARYNNVIAGIRTSVLQPGIIQCHDPVWLESAN
jgi:uncharacterized protein YcbX